MPGMLLISCFASAATFPGSASGTLGCRQAASATSSRLCRDDRADILAFESREDLARLEAVDDLQLLAPARAGQVVDHDALEDEVIEVAIDQLLGRDPRDVRGGRLLLRIVGVQAVFILDEDRALRAQELAREEH